jgi:hypothetical protein
LLIRLHTGFGTLCIAGGCKVMRNRKWGIKANGTVTIAKGWVTCDNGFGGRTGNGRFVETE